eukprot:516930-Amphidinium_carterae.1
MSHEPALVPESLLCGPMDRADTAATLTFVDVGLAMSLTLVIGAGFLAVVRALEDCQPRRVVSDCKGV